MVRSPRVWNCSRLALTGIDGLEAGKLVNDQAIGVGWLADVDPELLAVAQGDALAAVARHHPHDLGHDLAVVVVSSTVV
jgi:hypothetical protein